MLYPSLKVQSIVTKTLVCIDRTDLYELSGSLFNPYLEGPRAFNAIQEMINILDGFFDDIGFPQAVFSIRRFRQKTNQSTSRREYEIHKLLQDTSPFDTMRGELATFLICVNLRRNASWQGTVQWVERDISRKFRSTLELIKLMDVAVNPDAQKKQRSKWNT